MTFTVLQLPEQSYNAGSGCFGLDRCDGLAKRHRTFRRESTDGNKKAGTRLLRSQCRKFARTCNGETRDAALYRCGDCGGNADPDQDSPTCSCDRDVNQFQATLCRRPGGSFTARCNAIAANLADQNTATWDRPCLVPSWGRCRTESTPSGNDPIRQGFALSSESALSCAILSNFCTEKSP
jgi:hypothetical protein